MKKRVLSIILSCAVLGCTAQTSVLTAAAEDISADSVIGNLISNGTFEDGLTGWSAYGDSTVTRSSSDDGECYSSAKSMKLEGAGAVSIRMAEMYPQETYKISVKAKALTDDVTVTLKYDYAKKGAADIVSQTVSAGGWTDITGSFKWHDGTSYSYKGAKLNNGGGSVVVEVSGACLIDEVILKTADEKIIPPKSNDDLGGWLFRKIGDNDGSLEYDSTEDALYGKKLQKINVAMLYPMAMKKGAEYKLTAKIKKDAESNGSANVYFGSNTNITQIDNLSESEWTDVNLTYTCPYPTDTTYDSGTYSGTMLAFGGLGSLDTQLANLKVKDVSVTKADNNAVKAAVQLTASADTVEAGTEIAPSVSAENASGMRYKYVFGNETVASGCIGADETLPSYTPDGQGTLLISVTPFNQYGYGDTEESMVTVIAKQFENKGVTNPDEALGNLISGTFESGLPQTWKYEGVTVSHDIINTAENSVGAMKITGSGKITIEDINMYCNEVYDASVKVKSASDSSVTVSLSVNMNGQSKKIAETSAPAGSWTDVAAKFSRYSTTYKNTAAKAASGILTLEVSGDCYIDEFIVSPSKEMLLDKDGIRIGTAEEGLTQETAGWIKRGSSAELTYDETEGALKGMNFAKVNESAAQYTVLKKGSAYRLTADVKAVDASKNTAGLIYAFYSDKSQNVTLTSEWQSISIEVTADETSALTAVEGERIASSVIFGGKSSTSMADMYIRNASFKEIISEAETPEMTAVVLPDSALCGSDVIPQSISADLSKLDAVGFKYVYKLGGVPVKAGYASKQSEIPSYKIPADAETGDVVTLTVIPMNEQGICGSKMTSEECSVISTFSVGTPSVTGNIAAGESIAVNVSVANNTAEQAQVAVIAAYFEDNTLRVCGIEEKAVVSGSRISFTPAFTLPQDMSAGGKIRLFVWKGSSEAFPMNPVSGVLEVN